MEKHQSSAKQSRFSQATCRSSANYLSRANFRRNGFGTRQRGRAFHRSSGGRRCVLPRPHTATSNLFSSPPDSYLSIRWYEPTLSAATSALRKPSGPRPRTGHAKVRPWLVHSGFVGRSPPYESWPG